MVLIKSVVEGSLLRSSLAVVVMVCSGCGSVAPSSVGPTVLPTPTPALAPVPTPAPSPTRFAFTGRVTETLTGIPVTGATVTSGGVSVQSGSGGTFSLDGSVASARVTVSAPGYLARETTITAGRDVAVDIIHEAAPFSLVFYRQMARNTWEGGTALPLYVLPAAPAFYLQTKGLTSENISTLAQATRSIVPAFTGGRFTVTTFETGVDARAERAGWIVIELVNELPQRWCGLALIGASAGHIWMNTADRCLARGSLDDGLLSHEIGHALGFWHLDFQNALMHSEFELPHRTITDGERYHGAVAYTRFAGNRDIDVDVNNVGSRRLTTDRVLIVD
jgi:hypothetical protein